MKNSTSVNQYFTNNLAEGSVEPSALYCSAILNFVPRNIGRNMRTGNKRTMEDWKAEELFNKIMLRFDKIDESLDHIGKVKDCLDGDILLDNHDMCKLLGVTKRTLARYRQKKLISYYQVNDGIAYYRSSEVQEALKKHGKLK